MQMTDPSMDDHRALRRFRAALAAAEAAPSEANVAKLHQAALALKDQLRAMYRAAGSRYGDHREGLFRWLREVIAVPDREAAAMASDACMTK
jgi:hypothetical protein